VCGREGAGDWVKDGWHSELLLLLLLLTIGSLEHVVVVVFELVSCSRVTTDGRTDRRPTN